MAKRQTMEAIENTVDAVEETVETLERIPKVNLNGTTKKQQVLILTTVAVGSAAVTLFLYNRARKLKQKVVEKTQLGN